MTKKQPIVILSKTKCLGKTEAQILQAQQQKSPGKTEGKHAII